MHFKTCGRSGHPGSFVLEVKSRESTEGRAQKYTRPQECVKSSVYCLCELCAQHYSSIMGKYRRFKRLGAHFRSGIQLGSPCTSQLESNGASSYHGSLGGGSWRPLGLGWCQTVAKQLESKKAMSSNGCLDSLFCSPVTLKKACSGPIMTGENH